MDAVVTALLHTLEDPEEEQDLFNSFNRLNRRVSKVWCLDELITWLFEYVGYV